MKTTNINYPISFPNSYFSYLFVHDYQGWSFYNTDWHSYDRNYGSSGRGANYLNIIGYNVKGGTFLYIALGK